MSLKATPISTKTGNTKNSNRRMTAGPKKITALASCRRFWINNKLSFDTPEIL
jgi:hypothetical protein